MQIFGLGLLYFFFLYSVQFFFVPGALGTRVVIGLLGGLLLLGNFSKQLQHGSLLIPRRFVNISFCLILIFLVSLCTNVINGTLERFFFTGIISMVMILLAAYFVVYCTGKVYGSDKITFELISRYIIYAVVGQMFMSTLMFVVPTFRDFILGIQYQFDYSLTLFDITEGIRLIGFGSQFFSAGITNGFALILIAWILRTNKPIGIPYRWLIVFFVLITVVGAMMARTTLAGTALGIVLMLWKSKIFKLKISGRLRRSVYTLVGIGVLGGLTVIILPAYLKDTLNTAWEYGFEMFYNYFKTGTASTASTNALATMYEIYPTKLDTWIIGDGYWFSDPDNPLAYYMGIDVGHLRLIFYFGLIGLGIYFLYQFILLKAVDDVTGGYYRLFLFTLFLYVIILNFKGHADIIQYVALYIFLPNKMKCQLR